MFDVELLIIPEGTLISLLLEQVLDLMRRGKWADAMERSREALTIARERGGLQDLALARLYTAEICRHRAQYRRGAQEARRALKQLQTLPIRENVAVAYLILAGLYHDARELDEALQACLEAEEILRRLERTYNAQGRSGEAKGCTERLERIVQRKEAVRREIAERLGVSRQRLHFLPILETPRHRQGAAYAYEIFIGGEPYAVLPYRHQEGEEAEEVDLPPGEVHFLVEVPRDGWGVREAHAGDYLLLRQGRPAFQPEEEGYTVPGLVGLDRADDEGEWLLGDFIRGSDGTVFIPHNTERRILGERVLEGYVIAILRKI